MISIIEIKMVNKNGKKKKEISIKGIKDASNKKNNVGLKRYLFT